MHRILRWISRVLVVILIIVGSVVAAVFLLRPRQPRPPDTMNTPADLSAYLQAIVDVKAVPGLALAVVKDNRVVYTQAFGMADAPAGQPASSNSVWHWWSMTKPVTAVAILQLAERGQLSLDDAVVDHVPFFRIVYPADAVGPVTIRHLLTHSSGMPDAMPAMLGWLHYSGDQAVNQTEFVRRILPDYAELKFAPGANTSYSNLGYMVLGAVVESVIDLSYEDYVRQNILTPSRMADTDYVYTGAMAQWEAAGAQPLGDIFTPLMPVFMDTRRVVRQRAGAYLWLNRVYTDYTPSTGLIGPVGDAARFLLALLNGGELEDARLLAAPAVAQLWDESNYVSGDRNTFTLGLYVATNSLDGRRYYKHDGGGPGFGTSMALYPDQHLGLVVMANSTVYDRDLILEHAAQIDWGAAQ